MPHQLFLLQQKIEQVLAGAGGIYSLALTLPAPGLSLHRNPLQLPAASLIKVFIMAEAFRQAADGSIDLAATAAVTPDTRVGGAGPLEFAEYGTRLSLRQLIELMITESDNTAANMLIKLLGLNAVNSLAQALGCRDTRLSRLMMDFSARDAGRENLTSPADMNILLSRLYAQQCIDPASDRTMLAVLSRQTDKCKLPLLLPPATAIAHKTGELEGIEHDSGIIYAETPYILTIMTEKLPDEEQGRRTIAGLSRLVYDELNGGPA